MGILTEAPHNSIFIMMNKRVKTESKGCPTLSNNKVKAMEQILNAILLNNSDNISKALKLIFKASDIYNESKDDIETYDLISEISAQIQLESGVYLIDYSEASAVNRSYNFCRIYSSPRKKQNFIDIEFETDHKLLFNGDGFSFNHSFLEYLENILYVNSKKGVHNTDDEIYDLLSSLYEEMRIEFKGELPNYLDDFMNKYKINKGNKNV